MFEILSFHSDISLIVVWLLFDSRIRSGPDSNKISEKSYMS